VDFVNLEFGVRSDARVLGKDLSDRHHPCIGDGGSVGPVEVEGDERRGDVVLNENVVQNAVPRGPTDFIPDFRSGVWTQTDESGEALRLDVHGEG